MNEIIDYSNIVPEEALKEVIEAEKQYLKKKKKKQEYPTSREIVEAVIEAIKRAHGIHPDDFPQLVYDLLENKGYSTRYITIKRIWRIYESLVRKGVVRDVLDIVVEKDSKG